MAMVPAGGDIADELIDTVINLFYTNNPLDTPFLKNKQRDELLRLDKQVSRLAHEPGKFSQAMELLEYQGLQIQNKAILDALKKDKTLKNQFTEEQREEFIKVVKLNHHALDSAQTKLVELMIGTKRPPTSVEGGARKVQRVEETAIVPFEGDGAGAGVGVKRAPPSEENGEGNILLLKDVKEEFTSNKKRKVVLQNILEIKGEEVKSEVKMDESRMKIKTSLREKIRNLQNRREMLLAQRRHANFKVLDAANARLAIDAAKSIMPAQAEAKMEAVEIPAKIEKRKIEDVEGVEESKRDAPSPPTEELALVPADAKTETPPQPQPDPEMLQLKRELEKEKAERVALQQHIEHIRAEAAARQQEIIERVGARPVTPPPALALEPAREQEVQEDAMNVEDPQGEPIHAGGGAVAPPQAAQDADEGAPAPGAPIDEVAGLPDVVGGETGGDGADGRDDLLSPDEAKTLVRDEFQWRVDDTRYLSRSSRGKLGYGQGGETNVQPIQPFGTTLHASPDEDKGDSVFKQSDDRFEPFRGQHEIVKQTPTRGGAGEGEAGEEIMATAMTPFAKIGGQIIWIPFYEKAVKMYFTSADFEELVANVTEQRGKLKLKAPSAAILRNMQKTVDEVRASLRPFDVLPLKVRHENLTTRYAEWLELRQIMKAVAKYQKSTTGMYNQAGLFSGNLREAVSKAIDEAVGMVGKKQKRALGRGLEGAGPTQEAAAGSGSPAEFQAFNPFQVHEPPLKKTRSTLPRFF